VISVMDIRNPVTTIPAVMRPLLGCKNTFALLNWYIMKSNAVLQTDVQNAIQWQPMLHEAEIGVTAKDGVVSLSGHVDSYVKKMEVENAAKKVLGVKALVENIEVKFSNSFKKTDEKIAEKALKALKSSYSEVDDKVTIEVKEGWVTLKGELPWNYQKKAAETAVHHLKGVKGITNKITIKPELHDAIEQRDVEDALARSWFTDDHDIKVEVSGTTVTLSGDVRSWYQKEEAARIAWNTPGIWKVNNELVVNYDFILVD